MTWRCDSYMVCWEIVEAHLPSRVMRQFLLFQPIPQNVLFTPNVHKSVHKLKKGRSTDWEIKHAEYIQHWNDRYHHHVVGVPAQSIVASVEYMNWYWDRTVIHVVHPTLSQGTGFNNVGGTHELLMEGYRIMHREFANNPSGNAVNDVPQRYMNLAGASHRLHIESMHYSAQHEQFPGPPPQPVQRAPRQRRRRAPQMQPEASIHEHEEINFEAECTGSYRPEMPMTFQPSGPSTNEHGGPSSHPEDRPLEIDLNVEILPDDIFNMVDERNQSEYMSPPFGSQSYLPTGFSSPQLPEVPMRDMFGLQSRDLQSPVNFRTDLLYFTPDSQQMTMQTPDMEELMDVEPQQQGSWRLVRDRVPRERRPRGPCLTGDRHSGPSEHGDGAN